MKVNDEEYVLVARVDDRIYISRGGGSSWELLDGSPRPWVRRIMFLCIGILLGSAFLAIWSMLMR